MTRVLCAAAALAVLALAAAGCGGSSTSGNTGGASTGQATEGTSTGGQATIAGVLANDHGSKDVSGDSTEVEVDDFYFEPTVLKGTPGAKVTLELKNEGKVEHNFAIDSQKIDQDLEAGEDAKVTVTIPQSGEVSFYCKYHKGQGMAGALAASGS